VWNRQQAKTGRALLLLMLVYNRYPPGHGDVYPALVNSGVLDELVKEVRTTLSLPSFMPDHVPEAPFDASVITR